MKKINFLDFIWSLISIFYDSVDFSSLHKNKRYTSCLLGIYTVTDIEVKYSSTLKLLELLIRFQITICIVSIIIITPSPLTHDFKLFMAAQCRTLKPSALVWVKLARSLSRRSFTMSNWSFFFAIAICIGVSPSQS